MRIGDHGLLDTIVSLAANEAVEAGYAQITTAHLLIALSRISEGRDTPDPAAVKELVREFEQLGIEPRAFRRRLRAILGRRDRDAGANTLHQSAGMKAVFAAAERAASETHEPLTPVRLLHGVFASLGDEPPLARAQNRGVDDIPTEL